MALNTITMAFNTITLVNTIPIALDAITSPPQTPGPQRSPRPTPHVATAPPGTTIPRTQLLHRGASGSQNTAVPSNIVSNILQYLTISYNILQYLTISYNILQYHELKSENTQLRFVVSKVRKWRVSCRTLRISFNEIVYTLYYRTYHLFVK